MDRSDRNGGRMAGLIVGALVATLLVAMAFGGTGATNEWPVRGRHDVG